MIRMIEMDRSNKGRGDMNEVTCFKEHWWVEIELMESFNDY